MLDECTERHIEFPNNFWRRKRAVNNHSTRHSLVSCEHGSAYAKTPTNLSDDREGDAGCTHIYGSSGRSGQDVQHYPVY
jgi:hypothetical protein